MAGRSTPFILVLLGLVVTVITCARTAHRRYLEQQAAYDAKQEISGFVDFYYDYEVSLDGTTFPELRKQSLPLPDFVYRLAPPDALHDIVAAELALPDDRVQELVPLSRLSELRVLSITWPRYYDAELVHLRRFSNLQYLKLTDAFHLTDEGILEFANLKTLKVLHVSGDQISDEGIENLRRKMPACSVNGRSAKLPQPALVAR